MSRDILNKMAMQIVTLVHDIFISDMQRSKEVRIQIHFVFCICALGYLDILYGLATVIMVGVGQCKWYILLVFSFCLSYVWSIMLIKR